MKDLKLKDIILEHYRKVYETEMDGTTVRVWKPKTTTFKLPTYGMRSELEWRIQNSQLCIDLDHMNKVQWMIGNPDFGAWDAQIVLRLDPKRKTLDIYFAALLIRPFSKQAYDWYEAHSYMSDPVARLCLMWDSREFDRCFGYDTSFGKYKNWDKFAPFLYNGKKYDVYDPIDDKNFDPFYCVEYAEDEDEDITRRCVKLRYENGEVHVNAKFREDEDVVEPKTNHAKGLFHECAKAFYDFREKHPEITEIHFYTDEELEVNE